MPQIPNTNLTLSETEIQAVIDFAYNRSAGLPTPPVEISNSKLEAKKSKVVEEYDGEVLTFPDNPIYVNYIHNKMD